jgi:hypothetical protein
MDRGLRLGIALAHHKPAPDGETGLLEQRATLCVQGLEMQPVGVIGQAPVPVEYQIPPLVEADLPSAHEA